MVGQNLGSGNTERAERVVWFATKLVIVAALPLAVITVLFAKIVVGIFIDTGTAQANETVDHAVRYLRIRSVEFAFMAAIQIFMGAYRGAENTKTALMFALVSQWFGRVTVVVALVSIIGIGADGVWIGMTTSDVLGATIAGLWFTRGTWKQAIIELDANTSKMSKDATNNAEN